MARIYPEWLAATTYAMNDIARRDGILYRATSAITGNASNSEPRLDEDNWDVYAVVKIQDYYSLIEAIRLELNRNDDEYLVQSIPLFIQLAEESFQTRIRAPIQRSRRVVATDAESRIEVPAGLLQVINLRINDDQLQGSSLLSAGQSEILAGNFEEYIDLKRSYSNDFTFNSYPYNYDAPVYWFDSQYFNIAPTLEEGTEIEVWFYEQIPQLGREVTLTNSSGAPINDEGQTSAQWVAEGGGNTANNFVQATEIVIQNWFTSAVPQLLLYGALVNAESYLKEDQRIPLWQARFQAAEAETMELIQRFEEGRSHTLQLYNAYSN